MESLLRLTGKKNRRFCRATVGKRIILHREPAGIASADSGRPAEQENGRRAQESNLQSGMGMSVPEESGIRETATEEGGSQEDISFRVPEGHERTTREDIPAGSVNEAVRAADRQVDDSQNRLDNLRMERAKLVQKDKQLRRQMLDCRRGSEEYRSLEKERADVEEQTAQMDSRIAVENGRLNQLRGQAKNSMPPQAPEIRRQSLRTAGLKFCASAPTSPILNSLNFGAC